MKPEYYKISDELRDRLTDAVKPYMERIGCEDLVACLGSVCSVDTRIENEYGGKSLSAKETATVIAFGISESILNVLKTTPEGRELMEEITNIYTGEGKNACVIQNMPMNGEAPFILAALQTLFGPGIKRINSSLSDIHFGGGYPHRDLNGTVPAMMLHGMVVGDDRTPTLIIDPEEIVDAAASIRCEELRKDKIPCERWEVRKELVGLLQSMRYESGGAPLTEYILENGKKVKELTIDGFSPLQRYPYDISHLRFFNASCGDAMQSEVIKVLSVAVRQMERYEGVVIQSDELLVMNNRLMLHACAAKCPVENSPRRLLRAYLKGDVQGPYSHVNAQKPHNLDLKSPESRALQYAERLGAAIEEQKTEGRQASQ